METKMTATQNTQTPAALDAHLGFWLRFLSNHVSLRFQKLLEQEGVSVTEWVALRTLWDQAQTSHASLIQALGMTKGATSKVMSRLEEKGLAKRHLADGRTREQSLSLTDKGKTLVPTLAYLADVNDEHFFAHLRSGERKVLMHTLQALVRYHALKELPTN